MSRINIINILINDEGLKLKPYRCTANKLSIGVGRNIEDNGISKSEALVLLNNDIDRCEIECANSFSWFFKLDQVRKDVLVMLCFNLGITKLRLFDKMLEAIEKKDFQVAAKEMLDSSWSKQVGERAKRLSLMMSSGKYKSGG